MGFGAMHEQWLSSHLRRRTGERRSRLLRGHGHGEKLFLERVWWPLFGHFDHLHPEYEVADWRGQPYFVDFAWIRGQCRIAFEIKGYGPHVQQADRIRYRRELNRETFLQTLGYRVVSVPYDDLEESPDVTRLLVKSLMAPYLAAADRADGHSPLEREVLRYAMLEDRPVGPAEISRIFSLNHRTAVKLLRQLCEKGKLRPIARGASGRITRYERVWSFGDEAIW
jgi:DNA-binding CsgD family transcriptional regulator